MNKKIISEFVKYYDYVYNTDFPDLTKQQKFFKLNAIKKIIKMIENYPNKIKEGIELENIEGIGKKTILKINEIINFGKILETKPVIQNELDNIFGIGIQKAKDIQKEFGVTTVKELKKLVKEDKIKLSKPTLLGLEYYNKILLNIPRDRMDQINNYFQNKMKNIKNIKIVMCGSYRRNKPTSNDIDLLVLYTGKEDPKDKMEEIIKECSIIQVHLTTPHNMHYMGILNLEMFNYPKKFARLDIIISSKSNYYPALLHFTGPGSFNRQMRIVAKKNNYKLSQLGLYDNSKKQYVKIKSEKEIFNILDLKYIKPEDRI